MFLFVGLPFWDECGVCLTKHCYANTKWCPTFNRRYTCAYTCVYMCSPYILFIMYTDLCSIPLTFQSYSAKLTKIVCIQVVQHECYMCTHCEMTIKIKLMNRFISSCSHRVYVERMCKVHCFSRFHIFSYY